MSSDPFPLHQFQPHSHPHRPYQQFPPSQDSFQSNDRPYPPQPQPRPSATLRRNKTLVKPERSVPVPPLINPSNLPSTNFSSAPAPTSWSPDWWRWTSLITTFWAPPQLLKSLGGIKDKQSRQAWREKITLCWIALLLGGGVGFATVGLTRAFCPDGGVEKAVGKLQSGSPTLGIQGWEFLVNTSIPTNNIDLRVLSSALSGQDISNLFTRQLSSFPSCASLTGRFATTPMCTGSCPLPQLNDTTIKNLRIQNTSAVIGYSWDQVALLDYYIVINGLVLNLSPYITANPTAIEGDDVDAAIRPFLISSAVSGSAKDATRSFFNRASSASAVACMEERYYAGRIDKIPPGCFFSSLFLYASLVVILGLVLARFFMALFFSWFLSGRLCRPIGESELRRRAVGHGVLPEGANVAVGNKSGSAPWAGGGRKGGNKIQKSQTGRGMPPPTLETPTQQPLVSLSTIGAELFAVCLVTCYSEGESSIRATLDSIANATYSDRRKLLWVICDGLVTGHGEKRSTPDIVVGMLDKDGRFGEEPTPMGYIAVGGGADRENKAMVYAGHYLTKMGRRTPMIVIVKCGNELEIKQKVKKPGNRGKRDSQVILMNFFSRITYNDRMSPLDFDLFRKIHVLMGVTPDFFEVVLMVDADTSIAPDSITHLVNCMHHDVLIMGLCGETRIANKLQSWVTAIQVYEYFISHHLAKAFESVCNGNVTCLPGCFSMYRLKARRSTGDDWVPILVKPEIVKEYSQSDVATLHQRNLLLLGEDRFLTTLMLRSFPRRKLMFIPQARCRTIVPDTFSVLLSQRRRWINSTIHNLMELVQVKELCGTFCFSMQFVVFMDLLGTVVLPVAICLTYSLIVSMALDPPKSFQTAIPLILLCAVIGLPAILILLTARKVVYVAWMGIYLIALPIWNFVLPICAFWQMDNFEWGETRRVQGEIKSKKRAPDATAVFDGTTIPLRRWEDWERSRLRKIKRDERKRREMEQLEQTTTTANGLYLAEPHPGRFGGGRRGEDGSGSDTASIMSSEEDHWGVEIGGYNEENAAFPPPPMPFLPPLSAIGPSDGYADGTNGRPLSTLDASQLEAMLDNGFDARPYGSASALGLASPDTPDSSMPLNPFNDPHSYPQAPRRPIMTSGYLSKDLPRHGERTNGPTGSVFGYNTRPKPNASPIPFDDSRDYDHGRNGESHSSAVESRSGHAKKRSGGAGVGLGEKAGYPRRMGPL